MITAGTSDAKRAVFGFKPGVEEKAPECRTRQVVTGAYALFVPGCVGCNVLLCRGLA